MIRSFRIQPPGGNRLLTTVMAEIIAGAVRRRSGMSPVKRAAYHLLLAKPLTQTKVSAVLTRLKALFLLVAVGLVLPMAGAPLRFCMEEFQFASTGNRCEPCSKHNDCECPGDESPDSPGCISTTKLLPNGVEPLADSLPGPQSQDIEPQAFLSILPAVQEIPSPSQPRDRAPPGSARLFLLKRSLLL